MGLFVKKNWTGVLVKYVRYADFTNQLVNIIINIIPPNQETS